LGLAVIRAADRPRLHRLPRVPMETKGLMPYPLHVRGKDIMRA